MFRATLIICGLLLLAVIVKAQLVVDVSLINIPVTVTDQQGRHVPGLLKEDFTLEEDGKRQEIVHLTDNSELPVSILLLLDTTSSMREMMAPTKAAVDEFIGKLPPNDEVSLMTFDSTPVLQQSFTTDRDKLRNRLQRIQSNQAGTRLFDALLAGLNDARTGRHERQALVLFSDGFDTGRFGAGSTQLSDVLLPLRQSRLLVYGVGIMPNAVGMETLNAIVAVGGGNVWRIGLPATRNPIQPVLDAIAEELRHQYIIGYYPGHKSRTGSRIASM